LHRSSKKRTKLNPRRQKKGGKKETGTRGRWRGGERGEINDRAWTGPAGTDGFNREEIDWKECFKKRRKIGRRRIKRGWGCQKDIIFLAGGGQGSYGAKPTGAGEEKRAGWSDENEKSVLLEGATAVVRSSVGKGSIGQKVS